MLRIAAEVGAVSGDVADGGTVAIVSKQNKLKWVKIISYPCDVYSMSSHVALLHDVHF